MRTKPSARKICSAWPGFQPSAASRARRQLDKPGPFGRGGAGERVEPLEREHRHRDAGDGAQAPQTQGLGRRAADGEAAVRPVDGGRQRGAASSANTAPIACASARQQRGQIERERAEAHAELFRTRRSLRLSARMCSSAWRRSRMPDCSTS